MSWSVGVGRQVSRYGAMKPGTLTRTKVRGKGMRHSEAAAFAVNTYELSFSNLARLVRVDDRCF
jgi:hypothetical protein